MTRPASERRIAVLAIALLVSGLLVPGEARAADRLPEVVAVFNFAQRDGDPQHAWLSKGLADLLINQLADLPGITVVSRDRMQSLVSDYERMRARRLDASTDELAGPAGVLKAQRILFGTYAVRDGKVTLAIQASDVKTEQRLFEDRVEGKYADVLNLQRELARRTRAYLLGKPVGQVPIDSVPQWSSDLPAAEHLYAGVDLFDGGRYADAWLRFRQASQADPTYADALYWQGRMFYYLVLYENARPLLTGFLSRWPTHPRAGDAGLELVDSIRQSLNDPRELRDAYRRLRSIIPRETTVCTESGSGYHHASPLSAYVGACEVQAERALGDYRAAADLAIVVRDTARDSRVVETGVTLRLYADLVRTTGFEQLGYLDRSNIPFDSFEASYKSEVRITADDSSIVFDADDFDGSAKEGRPHFYRSGAKFGAISQWLCTRLIRAPEGFEISSVRVTIACTHNPGSPPFKVTAGFSYWNTYDIPALVVMTTDQGTRTFDVDLPHRCRFFGFVPWVKPAVDGQLTDSPSDDLVESIRLDLNLRPLGPDNAQVRVHLPAVAEAAILLDGRPALAGSGILRGVAPGTHELAVVLRDARANDLPSAFDFKAATHTITVPPAGMLDCVVDIPFDRPHQLAGWSAPRRVFDDYPLAKVPPEIESTSDSRPSMLRLTRGPLRGQLIVVWEHAADLWLSYSHDDGRSWSPPVPLPTPLNTAHREFAPRIIQDEEGRVVLAFVSDRGIERASYPYVCASHDLLRWTAPRRVVPAVAQSLVLLQDGAGRYLVLLPAVARPTRTYKHFVRRQGQQFFELKEDDRDDFAAQYARKHLRPDMLLFASHDLDAWAPIESDLTQGGAIEAEIVCAADGLLHAVVTRPAPAAEAARYDYPVFEASYLTSIDAVHWKTVQQVMSAHARSGNASLATDGRRVFLNLWPNDGHVSMCELPREESMGWTRFATTASVLYHDPAGFGGTLHWMWKDPGLVYMSRPTPEPGFAQHFKRLAEEAGASSSAEAASPQTASPLNEESRR